MTETKSPRNKLFLMMVLEFFIWGAWLPLIFSYLPSLGFTPVQQSWVLNAFPLAAIVGMFFSNQFADRHFAAEKFLGFSQLVGGLALLGLGFTRAFWPFFALMAVHCLLYVPTLSIVNSIAFANMKDPKKEFGLIRMGGTLGWILAAWPFTFILVDWAKVSAAAPKGFVAWLGTVLGSGLTGPALRQATRWTFIVAGAVSLALAAFSLLLPHTPAKKRSAGDGGRTERFAWLEALRLLKRPFVLILWLIAFIDAFVHNLYFNWTGTFLGAARDAGGVGIPGNWIMPVMSLGQVSELLTMLVLGLVLKKLGWKLTMLIGILGHAGRFAVYAFFASSPWAIVTVQIFHGICYAFFFATVYIFVDTYFPKDVRSSAQGLFNVMILGLGVLAANTLGPWLLQSVFTAGGITDFRSLFLLPCLTALAAAVLLAVAFRPPALDAAPEGKP
ncbi:MAG: MFS transporter [Candidatus Aminicenantes bacterium]|nr:MFS transporter [Candidatus Aminicenantes bacterium]